MKKTILTWSMLLLIASFTNGFSQAVEAEHKKEHKVDYTPEQVARKKTDHMTKKLGLDEKQQKAMYDINLEHAKKQAALKAEKRALKAKYQAEKSAYKSNVDDVLTEEQKAKLEELRAKQAERKADKRPPKPPLPPKPISPNE